jgi:hypothetical protein
MILTWIGAGVSLAGVAVLAMMWLSNRGADAPSNRDPGYRRDRVDGYDLSSPRPL